MFEKYYLENGYLFYMHGISSNSTWPRKCEKSVNSYTVIYLCNPSSYNKTSNINVKKTAV